MKRNRAQWTVVMLLGAGLFLAGCGETKVEESTSQAPYAEALPPERGRSQADQGATTPGEGQLEVDKEKKPERQQKQKRG